MPDEQGNLLPGDAGYVAPEVPPPSELPTQEPPIVEGDTLTQNQEPPAEGDQTDKGFETDEFSKDPADKVIQVPKETVVDPAEPTNPEYLDAKAQFAELYPQWNDLTYEQQDGPGGAELRGKLDALHQTMAKYKKDDTVDDPIIDPKVAPEVPPSQEPGPNPKPPESVTTADFTANSTGGPQSDEIKAEQTVDKAGRPAGFNPFYHGDSVVHEENPMANFMPSGDVEAN